MIVRKLTVATCAQSSNQYREYPGWAVGREHRLYRPEGADGPQVEVHLEGWATSETIEKHHMGDTSALPSFFFEARAFYLDGRPTWNIAGGHIEPRHLAPIGGHAFNTLEAAWGYVLELVEQHL